jgi:tight adherence protein B
MVVALGLFSVAFIMAWAAVVSVLRARRKDHELKVTRRLQAFAFVPDSGAVLIKPADGLLAPVEGWLARVGLRIEPGMAVALAVAGVGSTIVIWHAFFPLAGMIWAALVVTFAVLVPQVRYQQRVNQMVAQIPLFIDQVIRGLVTGRNVEGAIQLAMEDLKTPLREVIERAHKNVALGADLGEALRDMATFHNVKELHMLALAIQTSRTYGGSPREMLESVVNLIRQREQMQRELRAMTGETRVTAWVLGALPTVIAGFMVYANPSYIGTMWYDPSGRTVLMVAGGFQALGVLILWRMIKSI